MLIHYISCILLFLPLSSGTQCPWCGQYENILTTQTWFGSCSVPLAELEFDNCEDNVFFNSAFEIGEAGENGIIMCTLTNPNMNEDLCRDNFDVYTFKAIDCKESYDLVMARLEGWAECSSSQVEENKAIFENEKRCCNDNYYDTLEILSSGYEKVGDLECSTGDLITAFDAEWLEACTDDHCSVQECAALCDQFGKCNLFASYAHGGECYLYETCDTTTASLENQSQLFQIQRCTDHEHCEGFCREDPGGVPHFCEDCSKCGIDGANPIDGDSCETVCTNEIKTDKADYGYGESILVTFTNGGTPNAYDWIGIHLSDNFQAHHIGRHVNHTYQLWMYACGTQADCDGQTTPYGTVIFGDDGPDLTEFPDRSQQSWPLAPGSYKAGLIQFDHTLIALSETFVVIANSVITTDKSTYGLLEAIVLSWNIPEPISEDAWLAIYNTNDLAQDAISVESTMTATWQFVGCNCSVGSLAFDDPQTADYRFPIPSGTYRAAFMKNGSHPDQWNLITALSNEFTVLASSINCAECASLITQMGECACFYDASCNEEELMTPLGCGECRSHIVEECNASGETECGLSWGDYVLAASGASDCSGCGVSILNYDACKDASRTGKDFLGIGDLDNEESWEGPTGCHIQDGDTFQFNTNSLGVGSPGHTPVCMVSADRWGGICPYGLIVDPSKNYTQNGQLHNCGDKNDQCIQGFDACDSNIQNTFALYTDCCIEAFYYLNWTMADHQMACRNSSHVVTIAVSLFLEEQCPANETAYNYTDAIMFGQCRFGSEMGDDALFYRKWNCDSEATAAQGVPVMTLSYHYDSQCTTQLSNNTYSSHECLSIANDDNYTVCHMCGTWLVDPINPLAIGAHLCFQQLDDQPPEEFTNPADCFSRGEDWQWLALTCHEYQSQLKRVPMLEEECDSVRRVADGSDPFIGESTGIESVLTDYCCHENENSPYYLSRVPCEFSEWKPPSYSRITSNVPVYTAIRSPQECQEAFQAILGSNFTVVVVGPGEHYNEPGGCYYRYDTQEVRYNHEIFEDMVIEDTLYQYMCKDVGTLCDTSQWPNTTHECGSCIVGVELPGYQFTCSQYCDSLGYYCTWGGRSNREMTGMDPLGCAPINYIEDILRGTFDESSKQCYFEDGVWRLNTCCESRWTDRALCQCRPTPADPADCFYGYLEVCDQLLERGYVDNLDPKCDMWYRSLVRECVMRDANHECIDNPRQWEDLDCEERFTSWKGESGDQSLSEEELQSEFCHSITTTINFNPDAIDGLVFPYASFTMCPRFCGMCDDFSVSGEYATYFNQSEVPDDMEPYWECADEPDVGCFMRSLYPFDNHEEAQQYCHDHDSSLAVITNDKENLYAQRTCRGVECWLGMVFESNAWHSADGVINTYDNWFNTYLLTQTMVNDVSAGVMNDADYFAQLDSPDIRISGEWIYRDRTESHGVQWALCERKPCTDEIHCSGHGVASESYVNEGCSCTCEDGWETIDEESNFHCDTKLEEENHEEHVAWAIIITAAFFLCFCCISICFWERCVKRIFCSRCFPKPDPTCHEDEVDQLKKVVADLHLQLESSSDNKKVQFNDEPDVKPPSIPPSRQKREPGDQNTEIYIDENGDVVEVELTNTYGKLSESNSLRAAKPPTQARSFTGTYSKTSIVENDAFDDSALFGDDESTSDNLQDNYFGDNYGITTTSPPEVEIAQDYSRYFTGGSMFSVGDDVTPDKDKIDVLAELEKANIAIIKREDLKKERFIASGAFGSIYKGQWDGADFALKFLEKADSQTRNELLKEAIMIKQMGHHPHVMDITGYCPEEGFQCLVIQYIHGKSLHAMIQEIKTGKRKPMNLFMKLSMLKDAACGIAFIHKKRVIHRDIAARNLLFDKNQKKVKIIDFGMSRQVNDFSKGGRTTNDLGPIRWMGPENMRQEYTFKSDVWAFGCTMIEIFDMILPFPDLSDIQIVTGLKDRTIKPQCGIGWPPDVQSLAESCWEYEPNDRPSMHDIHKSLTRLFEIEFEEMKRGDSGEGDSPVSRHRKQPSDPV